MTRTGRCHCGNIRYQLSGEPKFTALCHCGDCRRSAGAPMVAWAMFPEDALTISQGTPRTANTSGAAMRSFCPDCGSGLFYRNADVLPGIVDVQSGTLDFPDSLPPAVQVQTAERLAWVQGLNDRPAFERFPPG